MTFDKTGQTKFLRDRQIQAITILIAILTMVPLFALKQPYILWVFILTMFYAILALSWNLLLGYTQLLSYAHPGLLAMGGYFSVLIIKSTGLSPIIGLFLSTALVTFIGLLIGWACLRLKGIYLALTTWGFSGAVQLVMISEYNVTGGLTGLTTQFLLPISSFQSPQYYFYVALMLFVTCALTTYKLIQSKYGLYLRAIGDDEEAAAACGVNIVRLRIFIFTLSTAWVGIAGAFYAHLLGYVSPALADFSIMIMVIAVTIMGGLGTFLGPILGAFVMWPVSEFIRARSAGLAIIVLSILIITSLKFFKEGFLGVLSSIYRRIRRKEKKESTNM